MTDPLLAHATEYGRMYARSTSEHSSPFRPSPRSSASSRTAWTAGSATWARAAWPRIRELADILGSPAKIRQAVSRAAKAAETYRDDAAKRGDRVHNYCEQVALRALGRPHQMKETREALAANGEEAFAARFDEWWELFQVWNRSHRKLRCGTRQWATPAPWTSWQGSTAGPASSTTRPRAPRRDGTVKPLDDKVVMQLVAGMKAEESLVDPVAGEWEPWKHGESPILLAVAIGETEVRPVRANPDVLKHHWWKFCALRRVWEMSADTVDRRSSAAPGGAARDALNRRHRTGIFGPKRWAGISEPKD